MEMTGWRSVYSLVPSPWPSDPTTGLQPNSATLSHWTGSTSAMLQKMPTRGNAPTRKTRKNETTLTSMPTTVVFGDFSLQFFYIHLAHGFEYSLYAILFPVPLTPVWLSRATYLFYGAFPRHPLPRWNWPLSPLCFHYPLNTLESCSSQTSLISLYIRLRI